MKLLVVFDEIKYNERWKNFDLFLIDKKAPELPADKQFTYGSFKIDRAELLERYQKQYDAFLKQIPAEYVDLFDSYSSTAFHEIITQVSTMMLAVSTIVNTHDITEIACDCYSYVPGYVPFYEAFGETNVKLLFKYSDFMSPLLKSYCIDAGITFAYLKKDTSIKLKLKIFTRRYCLLTIKLLVSLKTYILTKRYPLNEVKTVDDRPVFYISVRSTVHSEFMLRFVNKYAPNCVVLVGERQFAYGLNRNFWQKNYNYNVFPERKFLRPADFFYAFFKIVKIIFIESWKFSKAAKNFEMDLGFFKIRPFRLLPEYSVAWYEQCLHYRTVQRFLKYLDAKDKDGVVISTEQLTAYPFWLAKAARERGLKCIQVQSTLLNPLEQANFVRTDKFLFYDQEIFKLLSEKNVHQAERFAYWSYLNSNNNSSLNKAGMCKIVYFTQPYEFDDEYEIIDFLIEKEVKYGYQLCLKLHPRDQIARFKRFGKSRILNKSVSMNQIASEFDLAVTRTSSIGLDCFMNNLPVVFCILSDSSRTNTATFLDKEYAGYLCSLAALDDLFGKFDQFLNYFYQYNETFKKKNKLVFDKELFDRELKRLMA